MSNTDELRAAAQQALEALELRCGTNADKRGPAGAITALRAAMAQPAAPVVERADSATPVVERSAGNVSDNAAPVAPARWYCVTNYGGATLCTGRDDAVEVAAEQDIAVPGHGPHRAVMLAEVPPAPRLRWVEAPRRTEWGDGMMEALIALGVDETLRLYAHRDAVPMVDALLSAQPAPAPELSQVEKWNRAGREPFKFHPQASHVSPDYRDGWNAAIEAVDRSAQPAPALVPPGWVLVPVNATPEMKAACVKAAKGWWDSRAWPAMLAAASRMDPALAAAIEVELREAGATRDRAKNAERGRG